MAGIRWQLWWWIDRLGYYVCPDKKALLLMRKYGWASVKKAREAIAEEDRAAHERGSDDKAS